MLESGGSGAARVRSDALNEIESVGAPLHESPGPDAGRHVVTVWHGRCIPLEDLDHEAREWVPGSGWPFGSETVAPYLHRASEYLGAGACQPESPRFVPRDPSKRPEVDPALLHDACSWEDTPPVQFGQRVLAQQEREPPRPPPRHGHAPEHGRDRCAPRVRSRSRARRTGAPPSRRARPSSVPGASKTRASCSTRIASQERGVGNAHDVVGRYFMDHPRDVGLLARFDLHDAARARSLFGPQRLRGDMKRHEVAYGFALSPERQRREGLLNCSAMPYEAPAADDPLLAARRLIARPRTQGRLNAKRLLSRPGIVARGLGARVTSQRVMHKLDRIGFLISSEQVPDRDSRISLSEAAWPPWAPDQPNRLAGRPRGEGVPGVPRDDDRE